MDVDKLAETFLRVWVFAFLAIALALALASCTRLAPTAPSTTRSPQLGDNLETIYAEAGDAADLPQPLECKWRNMEIFNYAVAGGYAPTIITLSDGIHKAYIDWIYVEPGTTWALFGAEDNPNRWCTYPWPWR